MDIEHYRDIDFDVIATLSEIKEAYNLNLTITVENGHTPEREYLAKKRMRELDEQRQLIYLTEIKKLPGNKPGRTH